MLPEDAGGVVDSNLRVYGVDRLRVVDASVFPLVPDTHIQGVLLYIKKERAFAKWSYSCGLYYCGKGRRPNTPNSRSVATNMAAELSALSPICTRRLQSNRLYSISILSLLA